MLFFLDSFISKWSIDIHSWSGRQSQSLIFFQLKHTFGPKRGRTCSVVRIFVKANTNPMKKTNMVLIPCMVSEQIQVFVIVRDLPLPDISRHTLVRRWDVWKRVQLSTVLQFTKVFPFFYPLILPLLQKIKHEKSREKNTFKNVVFRHVTFHRNFSREQITWKYRHMWSFTWLRYMWFPNISHVTWRDLNPGHPREKLMSWPFDPKRNTTHFEVAGGATSSCDHDKPMSATH